VILITLHKVCHCDHVSSSYHRLLTLPDTRRTTQRWQSVGRSIWPAFVGQAGKIKLDGQEQFLYFPVLNCMYLNILQINLKKRKNKNTHLVVMDGLLICRNFSTRFCKNLFNIYLYFKPALWFGGQKFWLLSMRSRVRFPVLQWKFSLAGEDLHSDHGLGSLSNLGLRSYISPRTTSGQRNCALWAPHPQKSVTLRPQPGGAPRSLYGHVVALEKKIYFTYGQTEGGWACRKNDEKRILGNYLIRMRLKLQSICGLYILSLIRIYDFFVYNCHIPAVTSVCGLCVT
jgi:hypothetical protein